MGNTAEYPMLPDHALDLLDRHQARILVQIDLARALFLRSPVEAHLELAQIRWHLLRLQREYQVFKHAEIFDPVTRSSMPHRAATAADLKAACIAAGERYRDHVCEWTARDIQANWADYRRAGEEIATAIERHLAQERLAIIALLSGLERTRRA